MAKQEYVRAGKDHPGFGIRKGQMHYVARVMTGPRSSRVIRSLTPIPRSQLTSSDFLSVAYDLSDQVSTATSKEEIQNLRDEFENLQTETQEKLDNMPEGLQQGPTGELLQERIDQIETILQQLDEVIQQASDDDSEDPEDSEDGSTDVSSLVTDYVSDLF